MKVPVLAVLPLPLAALGGCAGLPGSFDSSKESVSIRMLTFDDLQNYQVREPAPQGKGKPREADVKPLFAQKLDMLRATPGGRNFPAKPDDRAFAPLIALAPVVAGAAIDLISQGLEQEATRYEAQFGGSTVQSGFWKTPPDGTSGVPNYWGFEVTRRTEPNGDYDGVAATFVYLFIPSPDAGEPLFLIHPFFSRVVHTKAKLAPGAGSATVISDMSMSSVWVDKSRHAVSDTVAVARFERGGVVPGEPGEFNIDPSTQAAGWFVGVPVSVDKNGQPTGRGVFRLTVNVTERDETKAKANIERVGRFLNDNKDKAVQVVTDHLGQ